MFSSLRRPFRSSSRSAATETKTAPAVTATRGRGLFRPFLPLAIRENSPERRLPHPLALEGHDGSGSNVLTQQPSWTNRPPSFEWVSQEQFQSVLRNFRMAHAQVELQRDQIEEQERQIGRLKEKVAQLEGDFTSGPDRSNQNSFRGVSSTDELTIKNAASALAALINRYASAFIVRHPQLLQGLWAAVKEDTMGSKDHQQDIAGLRVQSLLRHAISKVVCSGIVNRLLVTDSSETNEWLQRIHEYIFSRDPIVAHAWRRQTFSASMREFNQVLMFQTLQEYIPSLLPILVTHDETPLKTLTDASTKLEFIECPIPEPLAEILHSAWEFAKLLHESKQSLSSSGIGLYRAYVPELGSSLDATQMELVKRCHRSENQQEEVLGACLFPGLVKVGRDCNGQDIQIVIRRAQVICDCALDSQWQRPTAVPTIAGSVPLPTTMSVSMPVPVPSSEDTERHPRAHREGDQPKDRRA